VSATVMQQHEMPMFLLQQDFPIIWHVLTPKQPVYMPVLLNHQFHHQSHKSPLLHLLQATITRVSAGISITRSIDSGMWWCVVRYKSTNILSNLWSSWQRSKQCCKEMYKYMKVWTECGVMSKPMVDGRP
jgi:hypothetical protein